MFLPTGKGDITDISSEALHNGGHTYKYINAVNERIRAADKMVSDLGIDDIDAGADIICEELYKIKEELLTGNLKLRK